MTALSIWRSSLISEHFDVVIVDKAWSNQSAGCSWCIDGRRLICHGWRSSAASAPGEQRAGSAGRYLLQLLLFTTGWLLLFERLLFSDEAALPLHWDAAMLLKYLSMMESITQLLLLCCKWHPFQMILFIRCTLVSYSYHTCLPDFTRSLIQGVWYANWYRVSEHYCLYHASTCPPDFIWFLQKEKASRFSDKVGPTRKNSGLHLYLKLQGMRLRTREGLMGTRKNSGLPSCLLQ